MPYSEAVVSIRNNKSHNNGSYIYFRATKDYIQLSIISMELIRLRLRHLFI